MMQIHRGDVVVLFVPFTSGQSGKSRPALVVQSDLRNGAFADTVLAIITSKTHHLATDPTQLAIDVTTDEGRQTGLRMPSVVKCGHLITVEQQLIGRRIGAFAPALMDEVETRIKIALDLS